VTANAEESASASEELSGQALQLKEMLSKFKLRKRAMNLDAAGILNSITPEMLQMLKSMLQSQKLPAASAPAKPAIGRQPGKSATGARGTKPSSVIALDDSEFGNF
jgi:methyl-accepting chemotaxis protein